MLRTTSSTASLETGRFCSERSTPMRSLFSSNASRRPSLGGQLDFGGLEGIEALAAGGTLAPAPHRRAVFGQTGIDDPGVFVLAEGTVHARDRKA
jgi:hypothetical protein